MIIYFSATGNSKYVATLLKKPNEKVMSITDLFNANAITLQDDTIGIITPTYAGGLPSIVKDYLSKVNLKANYIYYVVTYGYFSGFTGEMVNRLIHNQLNARYSIKMVDTFTPFFNISKKSKQDKFLKNFDEEIKEIKEHINKKDKGNYQKNKLPYKGVNQVVGKIYEKARLTKNLNVNENCIGCGTCAKVCPVNAIEIKDNKPVWVKSQCVLCLSCLHHCPKNAINYKNMSKNHGQYINPNVK